MTIDNYFDTAFANSGDKTVIPDAADPSGFVSYSQGYTSDYQLVSTDPNYKPVERDKMNELFYEITLALQKYQQTGTPPFITTAMNGGSPYSYSKYNKVLYLGVVYQSLVNSNTDTPPTTNWAIPAILSSSGNSILKGDGTGGISNAVSATDYAPATVGTSILKALSGGFTNALAGTDYLAPAGNGSALTGITAGQISGLIFTGSFASSAQTLTAGGTVTVSHGLGALPTIVEMELVCTSNSNNFTTGQVLVYNPAGDISSAGTGWSVIKSTSNIVIRYGASGIEYTDPTSGGATVLDATKFTLTIRAFK